VRGILVCTYTGTLNGELFSVLLRQLIYRPKKPVFLVLDGLPAHKRADGRDYVASTDGKLSLHVLPSYAPDLNPDKLVWSHVKRTGAARRPLQKGDKLRDHIDDELAAVRDDPRLVRSFFDAASVAYLLDC
jgi:transposase